MLYWCKYCISIPNFNFKTSGMTCVDGVEFCCFFQPMATVSYRWQTSVRLCVLYAQNLWLGLRELCSKYCSLCYSEFPKKIGSLCSLLFFLCSTLLWLFHYFCNNPALQYHFITFVPIVQCICYRTVKYILIMDNQYYRITWGTKNTQQTIGIDDELLDISSFPCSLSVPSSVPWFVLSSTILWHEFEVLCS